MRYKPVYPLNPHKKRYFYHLDLIKLSLKPCEAHRKTKLMNIDIFVKYS